MKGCKVCFTEYMPIFYSCNGTVWYTGSYQSKFDSTT